VVGGGGDVMDGGGYGWRFGARRAEGGLGWCVVVRKRFLRQWEVGRRFRIHGMASLDLFESLQLHLLEPDLLD